jgi:hypothetical protein
LEKETSIAPPEPRPPALNYDASSVGMLRGNVCASKRRSGKPPGEASLRLGLRGCGEGVMLKPLL